MSTRTIPQATERLEPASEGIQVHQDYGKVVKVFPNGYAHCVCSSDGDTRGLNASPSTYPQVLQLGQYVLVQLRESDEQTADLVYCYTADEAETADVEARFEPGTLEEAEEAIADHGEHGEILTFVAGADPYMSSQHGHYLYLITGFDEDEVYCDSCERMIPSGGQSWTCLVPHCHHDQCQTCASKAHVPTDNSKCSQAAASSINDSGIRYVEPVDTSNFCDYPPPRFLINSRVALVDDALGRQFLVTALYRKQVKQQDIISTVFATVSSEEQPSSKGFWGYLLKPAAAIPLENTDAAAVIDEQLEEFPESSLRLVIN